MFEGWGEFYLLAGSAAAVLIGLIFVVVTLMQDRPRSAIMAGSRLYMGPVVLHVTFVLILSAAALVPHITARQFAGVAAAISLWGLVRGVNSLVGISRVPGPDRPHWSDAWCYGTIPVALFAGLAFVAWSFWTGSAAAVHYVAAVITALLLITIRNEWDLVTWLAPRREPRDSE